MLVPFFQGLMESYLPWAPLDLLFQRSDLISGLFCFGLPFGKSLLKSVLLCGRFLYGPSIFVPPLL